MGASTAFDLGADLSDLLSRVVRHDAYLLNGLDPVTSAGCLLATDHRFTDHTQPDTQDADPVLRQRNLIDCLRRSRTPAAVLPERAREHRWMRALFAEEGFGDPMIIVLRRGSVTRGLLVLLRRDDQPAFSAEETAQAGQPAGALAERVERFVRATPLQPAEMGPPGVLVIGPDERSSTTTPTGRAAMRRLAAGGPPITDAVLRQTVPVSSMLPGEAWLARIPTRQGWLAMHAELLEDAGTAAVTIGPASGSVLLPAVASWYGLTPREQDVVRSALCGSPAKRIARELELSLHTVNDHLKAVYRKTGLVGRDELAAALSR